MESDALRVERQGIAAWNAQGLDALITLLAPAVVWHRKLKLRKLHAFADEEVARSAAGLPAESGE